MTHINSPKFDCTKLQDFFAPPETKDDRRMKSVLNILIRTGLSFAIKSDESVLSDQTAALRNSLSTDDYKRIFQAREETRRSLAGYRSAYNATLPAGKRRTWRIA